MVVARPGGIFQAMGRWENRFSHIRVIRTLGAASVACLAFAVPAEAAAPPGNSSIAPIIGTWKSDGAVIKVTGPLDGPYQGTIVSGAFANCPGMNDNVPGGVAWEQMSGGGFGYSGKIPWVNVNDCSPLGDGSATWTLTSINSGTLKSTSPDGSVSDSASMTRVGTWPGAGLGGGSAKPKTNCKKSGKKVLCPGQKSLSNNLASLAGKEAKLEKQLKKANKAADNKKAADIASKMADKILKIQNKNKKLVSEGNLKTFDDLWKLFKLPQKERGPLAKEMAGNQAKQFLFGDQADKTLSQNAQLLNRADGLYQSDGTIHGLLETAASTSDKNLNGLPYDQLPESVRLAIAAEVAPAASGKLGSPFEYTNNAADLGIAGLKFTLTTKGVKL
jgi:hypothetical protein